MVWCFHCSEFVEEGQAVCQHCGRDPTDIEAATTSGPPDDKPTSSPTGLDPESPQRAAARPARVSPLAVLGVIGLTAGVGVVTLLQMSRAPEAALVSIDLPVSLGALGATPVPLTPEADVSLGPTWVRPVWADSMPGVAAFELEADNDVRVATQRFRPRLGISCAAGATSVYVMTGGAARIDSKGSGHTVHIAFHDTGRVVQQWLDADDHQALFAPEPRALASQLAAARLMRFGFTHYLSGPVVVEFDLRGADEWIRSVARPCGWVP